MCPTNNNHNAPQSCHSNVYLYFICTHNQSFTRQCHCHAFNSLRPNCQIKLISLENPHTQVAANLTCQSSEGVKTKNVARRARESCVRVRHAESPVQSSINLRQPHYEHIKIFTVSGLHVSHTAFCCSSISTRVYFIFLARMTPTAS